MSDLISRKALMRKLFFAEDGRKYPTRDIDNFPVMVRQVYKTDIIAT